MKSIDGNTPSRSPEVVTRFLNPAAEEGTAVRRLNSQKNPVTAFAAGLALGPLGLGLYLRSWRAFFIGVAVFVFLFFVLLPTGPGEVLDFPMDWIFSAIYGAYVVATSNSSDRKE
jgi:hypothetical protein